MPPDTPTAPLEPPPADSSAAAPDAAVAGDRGRRGYTPDEAEIVAARRAIFGSLIRALRTKARQSLSAVARKIGAATANTARSYEGGCYPAGGTIRRYGPVLGIKARDLALARLYCADIDLYQLLFGQAPPTILRRHLQELEPARIATLLAPLPPNEAALLRAAIRPEEGPLL